MNNIVKLESVQGIAAYWTQEQIEILKKTIAPGLNQDELCVFGHMCSRTQLDPFARQIYPMKHSGRLTIIISIDGFRLIAERTGKYAPGKETQYVYDENGRLQEAKVYIKKMTLDGQWHEVSANALMSEYSTGKGSWSKLPHVMLEKCAEARALRRGFPADFSGLYSVEEMDQAVLSNEPKKTVPAAPESVIEHQEEGYETISMQQYGNLMSYLNLPKDMPQKQREPVDRIKHRLISHLEKIYQTNELKKMPLTMFERALSRVKEEHEKVENYWEGEDAC